MTGTSLRQPQPQPQPQPRPRRPAGPAGAGGRQPWFSGERARLTALYSGLLVLVSGIMITLVYVLARQTLRGRIDHALTSTEPEPVIELPRGGEAAPLVPAEPVEGFRAVADVASDAALDRLLVISLTALACCAALSVLVSWWAAGRVLRPLSLITATARRLSGDRLHERIELKAPPGELKQLADTFDDMLARIETLLTAQQRFTANAAHELRTQLATQRAAAEIGLTDPDPERVERVRRKLVDLADDNERLIESLLLLSVTDQGLQRAEPVRLDDVAGAVLDAAEDEANGRDVALVRELGALTVHGEAVLLEHLVRNLVENAIRYNHPDGRVEVTVQAARRRGSGVSGLVVRNTGPEVAPEVVSQLFEPFRRLQARQHAPGEGAGLGLSLVASIARAHGATVTADANPGGGLTVRVAFPPPYAAPLPPAGPTPAP